MIDHYKPWSLIEKSRPREVGSAPEVVAQECRPHRPGTPSKPFRRLEEQCRTQESTILILTLRERAMNDQLARVLLKGS
jgi:hypothetical protein